MLKRTTKLFSSNHGPQNIIKTSLNTPNGNQAETWYRSIYKSSGSAPSISKIEQEMEEDTKLTNITPNLITVEKSKLPQNLEGSGLKKKHEFLTILSRPDPLTKTEKMKGLKAENTGRRFVCSAPLSHFCTIKTTLPQKYMNLDLGAKEKFSDVKFVTISCGKGGDGCVSFDPSPSSKGPASGGDGGRGGNVYIQADPDVTSLSAINAVYRSEAGKNGQTNNCDGKSGEDIIIKVPVGTNIKLAIKPSTIIKLLKENNIDLLQENEVRKALNAYRVEMKCLPHDYLDIDPEYFVLHRKRNKIIDTWKFSSSLRYEEHADEINRIEPRFKTIRSNFRVYDQKQGYDEIKHDKFPIMGLDMDSPTQTPKILLRGGSGGIGNMHFKLKGINNPIFAKRGRNGIEASFIFELKLLADIGLVGFPNAGKSSILRAISNAKPRVGHWEFTTLTPTLGTVVMPNGTPSYTVSDIPGIVEGASANKGMGLEFLRHIERASGIVFVLGLDKPDPLAELQILIKELKTHGLKDIERAVIICNKYDLMENDMKSLKMKVKKINDYVNEQNRIIRDKNNKIQPPDEELDPNEKYWNIIITSAKTKQNIEQLKKMLFGLVFDKSHKRRFVLKSDSI